MHGMCMYKFHKNILRNRKESKKKNFFLILHLTITI